MRKERVKRKKAADPFVNARLRVEKADQMYERVLNTSPLEKEMLLAAMTECNDAMRLYLNEEHRLFLSNNPVALP